jgi:hypothetical protein
VNPIDINDLAADADAIISGLPDHRTRGPILVTRDGQPEAVIIRYSAYAPRLHHFDYAGSRVVCVPCSGTDRPWDAPQGEHVGETVERCNKHWRETHMQKSGARS